LIAAGDETWNQPITNFVPELALFADSKREELRRDDINIADWSSITIRALASQLTGLPRHAAYSALLEQSLKASGLSPPIRDESMICSDNTRTKFACNRTCMFCADLLLEVITDLLPVAFLTEYPQQHPVISPFQTPLYSNAAYQILAYAVENITGKAISDLFQDSLVEPLNLQGTYYTIPDSDNTSFIPINASVSWWNGDALDKTPAGGYYSSINDMKKIGKAILNSTILTPALTRRWMKPHSFTAQ
jgi:CubicO group peptidase (beta-lactamase class C family)